MPSNNWEKLKSAAVDIAERVSNYILAQYGLLRSDQIKTKVENSLVTQIDKDAEKILVDELHALLPEATFITEEDTIDNQSSESVWIVDPIDGTTNFIYGIPHFAISIALQVDGRLVIGIVRDVTKQETFTAWHKGGAFLNDQVMRVSDRATLDESILATGFPYDRKLRSDAYFELAKALIRQSRGLRRMGSAALDLAYVACGRLDGYFERALNPWDVAGGGVLITEAGGRLSGFFSDSDWMSGKSIVACNPYIFLEVLQHVRHYLSPTT